MNQKDINTLWDDVRGWLTDATRTAIREAEDLSRRGRLKLDILNLSRKVDRQMAKLGGMVYDRASADPDEPFSLDDDAKKVLQEIAGLEAELDKKKREYEAEKKSSREDRG
ncbi:MAG: hypothetical protein JSU73_09140 [candidate division WOR-3 bacterium]|nr:MAG: hypothetical protein JSU73_09140 [candidate division WOR-3 bacterium]